MIDDFGNRTIAPHALAGFSDPDLEGAWGEASSLRTWRATGGGANYYFGVGSGYGRWENNFPSTTALGDMGCELIDWDVGQLWYPAEVVGEGTLYVRFRFSTVGTITSDGDMQFDLWNDHSIAGKVWHLQVFTATDVGYIAFVDGTSAAKLDWVANTWYVLEVHQAGTTVEARVYVDGDTPPAFQCSQTVSAFPWDHDDFGDTLKWTVVGFDVTQQAWVDTDYITFTPVSTPSGYYLRVYDPDDTFLVTLTEAKDIQIRREHNSVGTGKFSINRHSADATAAVLTPGNYVRVVIPQIDPDPIFGFFLEAGNFGLVSSDEEGGEDLTFEGRGSLSYWDRAIWLSESFLVPWWPTYLTVPPATPPSTAIGALAFPVGTYYSYTVSGGAVTGKTVLHVTNGFTAYYDNRKRYTRTGLPGLTLVHLSTGVHSGLYVNPFATGVRDYRRKSAYTLGPSVLMSSISTNQRPGEVLYAMYGESQSADRPDQPLPLITVDFTDTLDSDGNAWTVTDALDGVSAELGDDYLSTVGKLVNTGAVDVVMGPDLDMHAYNAYGRDLHSATFGAGKVRFAKAVNIADELTREYTDQPVGTFAEVIGNEEGAIARVFLPSPGSRPAREISVRADTTGTAALEALGLSELAARLLHSDAIGFAVATPITGAENELTGLYLPGPPGSANGNYWVGDLVTLHTGSGEHDFNEETVRVAAITISFSDSDDLRVVVEVGSGFGGMPQISASSTSSTGPSSGTAVSTLSDLYQLVSERDQPNGYPSLDDDGRISASLIPASTGVGALLISDTPSTPLVFADLIQNEAQTDLVYEDA